MTERKPFLPAPFNADLPCGPVDYAAKFPEPVHVECKGCREEIVRHLRAMAPVVPMPPPLGTTVAVRRLAAS